MRDEVEHCVSARQPQGHEKVPGGRGNEPSTQNDNVLILDNPSKVKNYMSQFKFKNC